MFRPDNLLLLGRIAMAAALIVPSGAAISQDISREKLRKAEISLDESRTVRESLIREAAGYKAEIKKLKRRMVDAAREAQDHETILSQLETTMKALEERQAVGSRSLKRRQHELARVVAALQRLARHPPIALVALPASPTDTMRSAILLRTAVPRLEDRARILRKELSDLASLRAEVSRQRKRLVKGNADLESKRQQLSLLIDGKALLERSARNQIGVAQARVANLAAQAKDLRDLVEKLTRNRLPPMPKPRPRAKRRRTVSRTPTTAAIRALPARGKILRFFGDRVSAAMRAKGLTISTRPAAQVVAPRTGGVVFAGAFKGYGELLIIEYAEGYHVLLAGMSRIDAVVGDQVLAGEPVGTMNPSSEASPTLYLELRRKGLPINPLPWLAATRNKVSG